MARFIILAMFAMGKKRSCSRSGALFDVPSLQESSELSIRGKRNNGNIKHKECYSRTLIITLTCAFNVVRCYKFISGAKERIVGVLNNGIGVVLKPVGIHFV